MSGGVQLPMGSASNVTFTCIRPIWAPILAGNFSRENALYGVTTVVWLTCQDEPRRVTGRGEEEDD